MISAIVLAAGLSRRMGRPKMVLPWGQTTVIGQVIATFAVAGVGEIVVVTGGAREEVEAAILRSVRNNLLVHPVYNPHFAEDSMLLSLQAGLAALSDKVEAAFVALGDQPQIEAVVIHQLMVDYRAAHAPLTIPSYQMRRGHPWLVDRCLWPEVWATPAATTLRNFLNGHADQIRYVPVDTPTVLADLDTPEDYERAQPA